MAVTKVTLEIDAYAEVASKLSETLNAVATGAASVGVGLSFTDEDGTSYALNVESWRSEPYSKEELREAANRAVDAYEEAGRPDDSTSEGRALNARVERTRDDYLRAIGVR